MMQQNTSVKKNGRRDFVNDSEIQSAILAEPRATDDVLLSQVEE